MPLSSDTNTYNNTVCLNLFLKSSCKENILNIKETQSAYHLYGKPGNSGENSNGTVHSGGMFSEKRSYLSRYSFFSLFPEFPEISVPFVHNYQCQAISERTAMPMTADLSDESLLFQTVRDVTVVLFSRLLSTDFLQHNCSTQGEKDLSFGRWFLCFTFAFMIRAFELNGAGKHLHPKLRIK